MPNNSLEIKVVANDSYRFDRLAENAKQQFRNKGGNN